MHTLSEAADTAFGNENIPRASANELEAAAMRAQGFSPDEELMPNLIKSMVEQYKEAQRTDTMITPLVNPMGAKAALGKSEIKLAAEGIKDTVVDLAMSDTPKAKAMRRSVLFWVAIAGVVVFLIPVARKIIVHKAVAA